MSSNRIDGSGSNRSNYPKHEFSKYIDQNFSYTNTVANPTVYPSKASVVNQLSFMRVNGTMMLEPRLQEYIKRKKFDKDNRITPCVPAEKEFQISQMDLEDIRCFFQGKPLPSMNLNKDDLDITFERDQFNDDKMFPSSKLELHKDRRVAQFKKKIKKTNTDLPINRGMFVPDTDNGGGSYYEDTLAPDDNMLLDARDFDLNNSSKGRNRPNYNYDYNNNNKVTEPELGSGWNIDDSRFDPRSDPKMNQGTKDFNRNSSQYRVNRDNDECDYDYNMLSTIGEDMNIKWDNVDKDIYLLDGVPQHTTKSYGNRNPVEHYFQYIDQNFQNPDNTVEDYPRGGVSTRLDNKVTARPKYSRNIMR